MQLHCTIKESAIHRRAVFSMQVAGVTEDIRWNQIDKLLPTGCKPDGFFLGEYTYPPGPNVTQHIQQMVEDYTKISVTSRRFMYHGNGLKRKVELSLSETTFPSRACADALTEIHLAGGEAVRIYATERGRLYISINESVYKRHSKGLKGIAKEAWQEHKIGVRIFDGPLRDKHAGVLISLEGGERNAIQQVKMGLDQCVTADVVKRLQRAHVRSEEKLEPCLVSPKTIAEYKQAISGGLECLQGFFGSERVSFDDSTDAPCVTIRCTKDQYETAKELLQGRALEGAITGTCEMCLDDNVRPLTIPGCGHATCRSCLITYCSIDIEEKFPCRCFASLDCDNPLPVRWLEDQLPPTLFIPLISKVIEAHRRTKPRDYVHCSGPDCRQCLTRKQSGARVICPSC